MLHRPCAAAALALFGLGAFAPVANAQNITLQASPLPAFVWDMQPGQLYSLDQLVESTAFSGALRDNSALTSEIDNPEIMHAPRGVIVTQAMVQDAGGQVSSRSTTDFNQLSVIATNQQPPAPGASSLALSSAFNSYLYYSTSPGPVTFTVALTGTLLSTNIGDAFGTAVIAGPAMADLDGADALAATVGIDLALEYMDLAQNIRNAAPTLDLRTTSVGLRKDSGEPGGLTVSVPQFSVTSQGTYQDCDGFMAAPICGTYQHGFVVGVLAGAFNGASAQYGLSITGVQTQAATVPEPGTVALTLSGLAGLSLWRRRAAKTSLRTSPTA
jgi:hypothetical protein